MICKVEGCEQKVHGRGWCPNHYHRWRQYGDPLGHGARLGKTLPLEPLWKAVRPATNGELAERCGVTRRTVERWKANGVPLLHADAIASRVGLHVHSLWPGVEA